MLRRLIATSLIGLLGALAPGWAAAATGRSVIVLVDASGSMAGTGLRTATDATARLLASLDPSDVVTLYTFSDGTPTRVAPTTDRTAILRTLQSVHATGQTAFLDTVVEASTAAPASQPCALLILSDGTDHRSRHSLAQAQQAVAASGCTVSIAAMSATRTTLPTLDALASAGHGTVFPAAGAAGLAARLRAALPPAPAASPTSTPSASGSTPAPSATTASTPSPAPVPSAPGLLRSATVLLVGVMTIAASFAFLMLLGGGSDRANRRRMERLIADYTVRRVPTGEQRDASVLETLEDAINPLLVRSGRRDRLALLLDGAGLTQSPEQWVLIQVAIAGGTAVALQIISGVPLVAVLLGAVAGAYPGRAWLSFRRRHRSRSFEEGLPDALMLIASSLRSGFALDHAIAAAGDQAGSAVAEEFRKAVQEVRIGVPLEDALDHAAQRIDSADFAWVVTALRIQRRTGGNLAETLITVSRTVRQRAELGREVKALTAEGRISAYVLIALPLGLFGFLMVSQPSYLAPLWSTPTGWVLSGVGVVMLVIGWVLMQRLIRVDV